MSLKDTATDLIERLISDSEFFLVDISVSNHKTNQLISVYVDSDNGITIEQCSQISRKLGKELDEEIDGPYTLVVSSPGADAPLKLNRQFNKNVGRKLKVVKTDHTTVTGKLLEVGEENIILETKKKNEIEHTIIGLENIKEAKVVISFK